MHSWTAFLPRAVFGVVSLVSCLGISLSTARAGTLAPPPAAPMVVLAGADTSTTKVLPDSLAGITTDTGTFAVGPANYSRYSDPWLCEQAVGREIYVGRWKSEVRHWVDTLMDRTRDTLPARAVQAARKCSARFSVTSIPNQDLDVLIQLKLQAGQDSLALMGLDRYVKEIAKKENRTQGEYYYVNTLLEAEPARITEALAHVAKIDSEYPTSWALRDTLHGELLRYFSSDFASWGNQYQFRDTALLRREAERIITMGQGMHHTAVSVKDKEAWKLLIQYAFAELMRLDATESSGVPLDVVNTVVQRAKHYFLTYFGESNSAGGRATVLQVPRGSMINTPSVELTANTPDTLVAIAMNWVLEGQIYKAGMLGPVAPRPPVPEFWFPLTAGDSIRPERGRLSTFSMDEPKLQLDINPAVEEVWSRQNKFKAGVKYTIIVPITGHNGFAGALSPEEEAETDRWYFQDYLRWPVNVAVVRELFDSLPQPDGRMYKVTEKLCPYYGYSQAPNGAMTPDSPTDLFSTITHCHKDQWTPFSVGPANETNVVFAPDWWVMAHRMPPFAAPQGPLPSAVSKIK